MLVTQFINSIYSSNTFIVTNDKGEFWLIDCGDIDTIIDTIVKDGIIKCVFFTHTHYDHIYGVNNLLKHYHDVKLYTNIYGKEALMSPKLNYSKYHQESAPIICSRPENINVIKEGDLIHLSDYISVNVFETPGHDKSCLCYKIGDSFFSGDSYIPGEKVFANFINGNKDDAQRSVERIKSLSNKLSLYPGHGNVYHNVNCI